MGLSLGLAVGQLEKGIVFVALLTRLQPLALLLLVCVCVYSGLIIRGGLCTYHRVIMNTNQPLRVLTTPLHPRLPTQISLQQ